MTALVVRDVQVGGVSNQGILIEDGQIAAVSVDAGAGRADAVVVDGRGGIALPGFVDAHAHLDKTTWGLPYRPNTAGPTLKDLTYNERRYRGELGASVADRSSALLRRCVQLGTLFMRTHVDVDTDCGLNSLEGVLAAAESLKDEVTVEIVAFPQSGLLCRPGTDELLDAAMRNGASVVGGIDPAGYDRDPARHLDVVFEIAERHRAPVDIHLHDAGELGAWEIELIAERTRALSMRGKVTVSHAFALGMVEERRQRELVEVLADADIALATAVPLGQRTLPIGLLRSHGVRVGLGNDGIRDLWAPYGDGDVLARAEVLAKQNGYRHEEELAVAVDIATLGGAGVLGIEDYGLAPGCRADLVVVPGEVIGDALVRHAPRTAVIKGGSLLPTDTIDFPAYR